MVTSITSGLLSLAPFKGAPSFLDTPSKRVSNSNPTPNFTKNPKGGGNKAVWFALAATAIVAFISDRTGYNPLKIIFPEKFKEPDSEVPTLTPQPGSRGPNDCIPRFIRSMNDHITKHYKKYNIPDLSIKNFKDIFCNPAKYNLPEQAHLDEIAWDDELWDDDYGEGSVPENCDDEINDWLNALCK